MKYVRCLYDGDHLVIKDKDDNIVKPTITTGKIYEVVEYLIEMGEEYIKITNNSGNIVLYAMRYDRIWFEDVTSEVRDNKINQILDES